MHHGGGVHTWDDKGLECMMSSEDLVEYKHYSFYGLFMPRTLKTLFSLFKLLLFSFLKPTKMS